MKSPLKAVLITGIFSGVGESVAQQLCQDGMTVYTLSKSLELIENNQAPVDVLINNVGFAQFNNWKPDTDWTSLMQGNLMRTLVVTQVVLYRMLRNNHGFIINLSSTSCNNTLITPHAYSAMQTSVVRMTQGLASSISHSQVKIAALTPARIQSTQNSSGEMHILQADEVAQLISGMLKLNNPALIRSKNLFMNNPEKII
ncbi:SDR family NAD(P)-dependent oxidoreductase [Alicyclobacillus fastidiosus]|uniref:SDR family NAD(P)-dependent oxidoreductase n=1 Tax=Alicyclobacillus fastidiosus TaxID=392011 RepID=A0ABY6ZCQ9_9BACL|nr:SDR family NAD(P)-dependent oxidoreductase [Alicyclobacillus fastidiosus]WAH40688.1 SDR family NAD(P)-dependent oxidoreductase [Alicyclobacillus fastidiosus]GMA62156.1 3-ketoacyl-ACP reductase [Alicyclobacillus fastidiosus]